MANYTRVRIAHNQSVTPGPVKNTDGSYSVSSTLFPSRMPGTTMLYDETSGKYFAEPGSNRIPVILTETGGQTPTLDKTTGYYTVGASSYNAGKPVGSAFIWDADDKKLYAPSSPSSDYTTQLRQFENQYKQTLSGMQKFTSMQADYDDPHQVNSLVDVFVNSFSSFKQDVKERGFFDWYVHTHGQGIQDYMNNMLVRPLTSKDLTGWEKPKILLSNAFVGIAEVGDIFSGPVKAEIIGGDWRKAFQPTYSEGGRSNYDYETTYFKDAGVAGGAALDFVANLAFEILSDPTTLVSLGLSAATSLSSGVDDLVIRSVKEAGGEIDDEAAKRITKIIKRRIKSDSRETLGESLGESISKGASTFFKEDKAWKKWAESAVALSKTAGDVSEFAKQTDHLVGFSERFIKTLTKNIDEYQTTLGYKVLASLKTVDDVGQAVMKGAMSASVYTSALGLGAVPLKILRTAGPKVLKLYKAWENKTLRNVTKEQVNIFNVTNLVDDFVSGLDTMFKASDAVLDEELTSTVVKPLVDGIANDTFNNIDVILSRTDKPMIELFEDVNKYLIEISGGTVKDIKGLGKYIKESEVLNIYGEGIKHRYNSVISNYNNLIKLQQEVDIQPYLSVIDEMSSGIKKLKALQDDIIIDTETGAYIFKSNPSLDTDPYDELAAQIAVTKDFNREMLEAMVPKLEYPRIYELMEINEELSRSAITGEDVSKLNDVMSKELDRLKTYLFEKVNEIKVFTSDSDMPNMSKASDLARRAADKEVDARKVISEFFLKQGFTEGAAKDYADRVIMKDLNKVRRATRIPDESLIVRLKSLRHDPNIQQILNASVEGRSELKSVQDNVVKLLGKIDAIDDALTVADLRQLSDYIYVMPVKKVDMLRDLGEELSRIADDALRAPIPKDAVIKVPELKLEKFASDAMEYFEAYADSIYDEGPYEELHNMLSEFTSASPKDMLVEDAQKIIAHLDDVVFPSEAIEAADVAKRMGEEVIAEPSEFLELRNTLEELIEGTRPPAPIDERTLTAKLTKQSRAYTLQLSKAGTMDLVLNNNTLNDVSNAVYHRTLGIGSTLDQLAGLDINSEELTEVMELINQANSLKAELFNFELNKNMVEGVVNNPALDKELREGVLDSLADGDAYFRAILNASWLDLDDVDDVNQAATLITDYLLGGAVEYETKITGKFDMHFYRNMNTPDPRLNLENIFESLKNNDEFLEIADKLDDDLYTNVYYSIATDSGHGEVYGIAFGTSLDDIVVARNKDVVPAHSVETARYAFGMRLDEAAEYHENFLKHAPEYNTEDFYLKAIGEKLDEIKVASAAEGKQIRFISANNKADALKLDMKLNQSFRRYNTRQYLGNTEDILQMLRVSNGYLTYSDEAYGAMKSNLIDIIHKAKSFTGIGLETNRNLSLVANISSKTIADAEGMLNTISKYLKDGMGSEEIRTVFGGIRHNHLMHTERGLEELVKSMKVTYSDIRNINDVFKNAPIDEAELTRVLGYSGEFMNVSRILDIPMLKENGEVALLNLKKQVDIPESSFWLDMDKVAALNLESNAQVYAVWNLTKDLKHLSEGIVNNALVNELSTEDMKSVKAYLMDKLEAKRVKTSLNIFYEANKDMTNKKHLFAQIQYLYNESGNLGVREVIDKDLKKMAEKNKGRDVILTLLDSEGVVYNKRASYVFTSSDPIKSSLIAANSDLNLAKTLTDQVGKVQDSIDDINLAIKVGEDIASATNTSSPVMKHRNKQYAELVKPIQKFKDEVNSFNDMFLKQYESDVRRAGKSVYELDEARMRFAENRKEIDKAFNTIKYRQSAAVAEIVLGLDPEQFTGHLYKHSLGKLVVDTNASVIKDMGVETLPKFERMLKQAEHLGVKYETDDRYIKVWFDKTMFNDIELDEIDSLYQSFTLGDVSEYLSDRIKGLTPDDIAEKKAKEMSEDIFSLLGEADEAVDRIFQSEYVNASDPYKAKRQLLAKEFANVVTEMNKYMDDGFTLSSYNASTVASHSNLSKMFSESAQASSLSIDFLQGKNMFDATFNNSFIGDYGAGARDVYEFMSPNILVNMMTGVNMAKSKLDFVTDELNWYFNPTNSFANFVQHVGAIREKNVDWSEIKKAFDDNGYVIHSLKEDSDGRLSIVELALDTLEDFENALYDTNATYSTRATMRRLQDVADYKNIPIQQALDSQKNQSKVYKMYKQELRPLFITGYLSMDPATWVRNYTDGSMKGIIQTKGDPAFIKRLMRVHEADKQWDTVRIDIITKMKGVSPKNIHEYFETYPKLFKDLDEDVFLTILEIKNHSATSMSQSQLKWYKDPFKVLRSYAPSNVPNLDIKRAIKVFDRHIGSDELDHVLRKTIFQELLEEVGEENAKLLLPLRRYYNIPEDGSYLVKKLRDTPIIGDWINFNNGMFSKVEDDIRLALAMYYVDDLGYNVSMAVDKVIESQFDYGKSKLMSFVENIFPFTTFKAYNTVFWAYDAPNYFGAIKAMDALLGATVETPSEDDILESARLSMIRAKVAAGDYSYDNQIEEDAWEEYMSDVEGYSGVDSMWGAQNGYIRIGDNNAIKLGNSALDVMQLFADPIGTLADSLFAPIQSVITLSEALEEEPESVADLVLSEDYAISALVPVLGVVYNKVKAGWKNHNTSDFFLATIFPGLFGILREPSHYRSRPVGYDWYNQDEEYKSKHQFVPGVSYIPSWVRKNPTSYVDTYGRLQKLGYTPVESAEMMADGWYMNTEYELRNVDDYDNMPKVIMYDYDTYDRTLKELRTLGWTANEARDLMLSGVFFDETGQQRQATEHEIKYGKNYPSRYGTGSGRGRKVYYKKTYAKKFRFTYPKNIYTSSFRSRGYRNINKVRLDSNRTRSALSLRSSYPAAYRNVVYANRRNMYKGLYAKYGASRMAMRQNQVGYSNASITRLRRKEIQQNRYRNRRSF